MTTHLPNGVLLPFGVHTVSCNCHISIGIELHNAAGGARRFCDMLKTKGLLCKETHDNVIRFAPPLIITQPDIDWALERIQDVLTTK